MPGRARGVPRQPGPALPRLPVVRMRTTLAASGTLLAVTSAAACGSGGGTSAASPSAHSAMASPSPAPVTVTCDSLASVMEPVVSDQASQDANQTQNWVGLVPAPSGGSDLTSQGVDLQIAARAAGSVSGVGQLAAGTRAFSDAAGMFLADQGDGLMPGWDQEYKPLEADIKAIAALCAYPGNTGASP